MAKGVFAQGSEWCMHGQFLHKARQATCISEAGTCDASVMMDQQRCRSSYLSCGSNIKSTHSGTVRGELPWRRVENRCPTSTVESSVKPWQRKKLSRDCLQKRTFGDYICCVRSKSRKRCCPLGHCGFSSANQRQREEKWLLTQPPFFFGAKTGKAPRAETERERVDRERDAGDLALREQRDTPPSHHLFL